MIVLVFGGRKYNDPVLMDRVLSDLHNRHQISLVIEGDAPGADQMAGMWAELHGIHVAKVPALWKKFGNQAGPMRNRVMLRLQPHLAVGFPGGSGTADMTRECMARNIPLVMVMEDGEVVQPIAGGF